MVDFPAESCCLSVLRKAHQATKRIHAPLRRITARYDPALFPDCQPMEKTGKSPHNQALCASVVALVEGLGVSQGIAILGPLTHTAASSF